MFSMSSTSPCVHMCVRVCARVCARARVCNQAGKGRVADDASPSSVSVTVLSPRGSLSACVAHFQSHFSIFKVLMIII